MIEELEMREHFALPFCRFHCGRCFTVVAAILVIFAVPVVVLFSTHTFMTHYANQKLM
jgi:hypothetical protein